MSTSPGADERIADGTAAYTGWPAEVRDHGRGQGPHRKSKRGRRKPLHTPPISITSLTDCVTLLLVYLLKTFTTSPLEVTEPSIFLPVSTSRAGIEQSTIVMVTGPQARRSVEGRLVDVPTTPRIIVDGRPVLELDAATYRIPEAQKDKSSGGYVVLPLREELKKAKEVQEVTAQVTGKDFDGTVIILADKATPYRVLTDVLVTCGEAGFGEFRFAVIKPE